MDAGLQIKELAQIAGLSEMTIVNWEQGRTRPKEEKLARLTTTLTRCRCSPQEELTCSSASGRRSQVRILPPLLPRKSSSAIGLLTSSSDAGSAHSHAIPWPDEVFGKDTRPDLPKGLSSEYKPAMPHS